MTATPTSNGSTSVVALHLAVELGWSEWKLAFTIGHGQQPRLRTIRARNLGGLLAEIGKAKRRFGLATDAPLVSCYEAGRPRWRADRSTRLASNRPLAVPAQRAQHHVAGNPASWANVLSSALTAYCSRR